MKTTHPSRPFSLSLAALLGLATLSANAIEYTTGFETDLGGWSAIKGTSYFNWARWTGGTHSGHTGPASAHERSYYLYLEASRNHPARTAYLQSRDYPGSIQTVSFHYHMYGAHMGELALEGLDGGSWTTLWATTGQQHPSHGASWTRKEINLSGRTIQKIRFKGTTIDNRKSSQYRGDMAIDYVLVTTSEPKSPPTALWSKSDAGRDIYYAHGNVGIGDNQPEADLAILGNLSKPLTGHIAVAKGATHVTGVGTRFTGELAAGDSLRIGDSVFIVTGIADDTNLTLDAPHPVGALNATAYTDSDLLSVQTGAEKAALLVDKSGNVGIGAENPAVKLDVRGGIRVGAETVCDAKREGTIRYSDGSDEVEFCNGSAWSRVEGPRGEQGIQGNKGDKREIREIRETQDCKGKKARKATREMPVRGEFKGSKGIKARRETKVTPAMRFGHSREPIFLIVMGMLGLGRRVRRKSWKFKITNRYCHYMNQVSQHSR
uniref:MAM domain-containing protein, meprin/A5/mu n=1 Tax=Candidatus Kentrum sp. UNK TaxID=2126344 RepID=A0A451AY30_9GAMM|nr:MAG: MAM domain-containing protein, meprin/A5/mu [Candidatus Kentron sp. UNK]VFK70953.1 MAG: MAM domain-containing protein, meprin/A5/mu [Candidatus Kentron sp. UNK]